MNIVFFGSSQFAVPALKALAGTKHSISCVVTQPDRQKGRGLHFEGTAVKAAAKAEGLKVYQPANINADEVVAYLCGLKSDLFIVVSYGQILSRGILKVPKIFCVNIHASMLPAYRGAAPMNWAIINGEKTTGISVIKMVEKMDAGEILLQESADIADDETIITLGDKLCGLGARLLPVVIDSIENNNYRLISQDETRVSLAPKLKKEDGLINWDKSAEGVCNLIRGLMLWPGAFTYYKGKLVKIYKSGVTKSPIHQVTSVPGQIIAVSKEGIEVAAGKGSLLIQELQIEGKRVMRAAEFIAGHKISAGERLGVRK